MDYITKPFQIKELLARIAVQLRNSAIIDTTSTLIFEDILLNTNTHIASIGKSSVKLTRTEDAILKILIQNSTQIITKTLLLEHISENTPDCTESSLKYISVIYEKSCVKQIIRITKTRFGELDLN